MGLLRYDVINTKKTIEKAIDWAHNRSNIYENYYCFVVCKFNDEYIIHTLKYVIDHIDEYKLDDVVYCTNYTKMEKYLVENLPSS